ncbi:hypothetical protein WJX82_006550 [Trebouxia sp. C0006]
MEQIAGNTLTGNAISGGVGSIGIDFATGLSVSGNIIQDSMDGVPGLKTQNNLGPMFGLSISGYCMFHTSMRCLHSSGEGLIAPHSICCVG